MSAGEVRSSVGKALSTAHSGTGTYPDYIDHTGDEKSGMVRYNVGGYNAPDFRQAPYSQAADTSHSVDLTKEKKVAPVMSWREKPVKKTKESEESVEAPAESGVRICESALFPSTFEFREASAVAPLVKIISPGRGSSGFYSKEVLQRDGPKIFKRGTLMYVNHATAAEEAQRPEGDWSKLAAVTTGDAYWDEAGKDGAALYAPAKVFSGYAAEVAEKAPHTGVSIRAQGTRDDKAIAPDGKPGLITSLTHSESIDLVTKAGRDGKLLLESADPQFSEGGSDMDANALKKLQEANLKIFKGFATGKARELAAKTLGAIRLPEASRTAIMERACADVPVTESGDFDEANFLKVLEAEVQYAASFLPAGAKVVGIGATAPDPKVIEAEREKNDKLRERAMDRSANSLGLRSEAAKRIFREGRAAFDPNYVAPLTARVEV